MKRAQVKINNRIITTKLLKNENGAINGVLGFDCRTGEFYVIKTKAAILCCGAEGRLGLPSSGYLMGTYENPTNAGDGYAMAYHAGAELANLECFQINPLIKDYNGPACAYATGPLGGYTANSKGERFIECDYWSGQMMWEFYQELESGNGPVFLKVDHLAEETIQTIEEILHTNERPSRGRFHEGRGTNYRSDMVEMHISEIGFCSGHSASGVWVNEKAETSVKGLSEVVYLFHGPRGLQTRDLTWKHEYRQATQTAVETLKILGKNDGKIDVNQFISEQYIKDEFSASKLNYAKSLANYGKSPLVAKDALTGKPIQTFKHVTQIWVKGENHVRSYETAEHAFQDLKKIQQAGQQTRVVYSQNFQTDIKLLSNLAWFATNQTGQIQAFLLKDDATKFAQTHSGKVYDFKVVQQLVK